MTISLSTCTQDIQTHLAVIGKRMYDKEGKNLFSSITTSSAETPVLSQYVSVAAQNVAAALAQFVTAFSDTSITVADGRWESAVSSAVSSAVKSYVVLFSVGEYLAMTHQDLAKKYYNDAQRMMDTILISAYHKNPPV